MKTTQLTAVLAAAALTLASLSAIDYNVPTAPARATAALTVTNLAPVYVHPTAVRRDVASAQAPIAAAMPHVVLNHAESSLVAVAPGMALQ